MRGRGGIVGVLAMCGAVAMAGPARADRYDFIAQLDNMGVYYTSAVNTMCWDAKPAVVAWARDIGYTQPL